VQYPGIAPERIIHPFPAFNAHLDEITVGQHPVAHTLEMVKWQTAMKHITCQVQSRQPGKADVLFDQKPVSLVVITFANERRRRDPLGEGVHPLKALAVVRHHFAGAPQIIQRQRAVLAPAITVRARPRRHLEIPVAHGAALA
jgi:hypothetical protein